MRSAISQHLQDGIARLCITSTEFLGIVRHQLHTELLTSSLSALVVDLCFAYHDQFHCAPGDHFHDEAVRVAVSMPRREAQQLAVYAERLAAMKAPNMGYVVRRLNDFIRARELGRAAVEFAELDRKSVV